MNSEGRKKSWRRKSWISTSFMTRHLHAGNVLQTRFQMFVLMSGHGRVIFCDLSAKELSHHCRQKNWISLKMKKLMKTRSRDQQHVHSSGPPLHSESCEGLDNLPCRDNGSLTGSQGSEESASNSLNGDGPSPRKSSSEYDLSYLKRSPFNQERPEKIHPFAPAPASSGQANIRRLSWDGCVKEKNMNSHLLFRKIFNFSSPKPETSATEN